MMAILVPVKRFGDAKRRLAAHYSPEERAALASALCEDMFATLASLARCPPVFVASAEERVLALARARGWNPIAEAEQISESHSVDAASRYCAEAGISRLLRLPIDIPLAEPGDIAEILRTEEPVAIVPSRDGTGTNALLRSPPCAFASHFGPGSFARHLREADLANLRVKIIENPRLALDLDDRDDLTALAGRLRPGSATARWFSERGRVPPRG